MNKLEMAHEMACAMMASNDGYTIRGAMACAWEYADAMQAEADKREHKHMFLNNEPCICGVTMNDVANKPSDINDWHEIREEEWQPDWSQAPTHDTVAWDINEHGQARWIASDNGYYLAPSFNYQGSWQDSLRKRPE